MIEQQGGDQGYGAVAAPEATIGRGTPVATTLPRARGKSKLRPDERAFLWISRVIIWLFMLAIIFPVVMVVLAAFSPGQAFYTTSLLPSSLTLQHFQNVLDPNHVDFLIWVRNSMFVCVGSGILSVVLVASTGYAFSRFRFKGKKYGLMTLLLIQMFPVQMSFIAFYVLLLKVHLLNSLWGLLLVYLGGGIPFNAWLFKGYVDGLPRDLEESAYVDGATRWQAFYKIVLPLTRPMMAVIFIFVVIGNYNEYILANFLISDSSKRTLAVGLQLFIYTQFNQNWTDFAAAAVLASLPILILFLIAQRWLVSGLAAGAVKG